MSPLLTQLKNLYPFYQVLSTSVQNMLYSGIESGSDNVLEIVNKGVTQNAIIQASLRAGQAGMSIMAFVIWPWRERALS
jgi:hypothetical protein